MKKFRISLIGILLFGLIFGTAVFADAGPKISGDTTNNANNKYYSITSGGTVFNLNQDITLTETWNVLTGTNPQFSQINLNGHTITGPSTSDLNPGAGTLCTIKIGTGSVDGTGTGSGSPTITTNLVISNGSIKGNSNIGKSACVDIFGGKVTFNGVTLTGSDTYFVLRNNFNSEVILDNGTNIESNNSCLGIGTYDTTNTTNPVTTATIKNATLTNSENANNFTIQVGYGANEKTQAVLNLYSPCQIINNSENYCKDNSNQNAGIVGAIYQPNNKSETNIYGGTVTGYSGIVLHGGELNVNNSQSGTPININGTGTYNSNPDIKNFGTGGCSNGDAIVIESNSSGNNYPTTQGGGWGNVSVNIAGTPEISSVDGYAIGTLIPNNPAQTTKPTFTNSDGIEISGGTFSGTKGSINLDEAALPSDGDTGENFITGGVYSDGIPNSDYLSPSVTAQATVTTSDGEKYTVYGKNSQDVSNQVISFKNSLPVGVTVDKVVDAPVLSDGKEASVSDVIQSSKGDRNFGIANVELGNEMLQYVNTTNPTDQSANVGLSIVPNSSPYYFANALDWQLTSLSTSSNSSPITFLTDWVWDELNGQQAISTSTSNGNWTLYQTYTTSTNSKGDKTYIPGQTYLGYNGSGSNPGIYSLTATVQAGAYYQANTSQQNLPSDSIRLVVGQNLNISNVTITPSTSPTSFNMDTTPSVQFNYTATNTSGQNVQGTIVNWSLGSTGGIKAEEYAYVNSTTGLVTFYQPTPENSYLMLQVTVNGVPSNYVLFAITGTGASTDLTDETLVAWNNPVNIPSGQSYNLASNMYALPGYRSLAQSEDLKFTTDNPNVLIYNNYIFANNSNYTGEVEVTATYTNDDGTTASTTFTVNLVSKTVNPTGVTAQENLSFVLGDITTQNVLAKLTPENTTTQTVPGNNSTNGFSYTTSNSSVASVDSFGNVRAVGLGTATITTTYLGNLDDPSPNVEAVNNATTTVTVTETPSDIPATSITANPTDVYLAPSTEAEADHSKTITVITEPENTTDEITYTVSPQSVATVTDNGDGTYTVTAGDEGRATITFTAGDVSATVDVLVSDEPVIAESITASGTTPDTFTVNVNNVGPNPAIHATGANISHVSIFTWSGPDQVDRQCKAVPNDDTGNYSYTPFEVNGNRPNTWYFNADNIYVQCYANVDGEEVYLGAVTPNYKWVNAATAGDHHVAYITYQENRGFNVPTVFDGAESGVTGQHLQLEGLRVSSNIEGVDVVTEVHAQNIGWSATRS